MSERYEREPGLGAKAGAMGALAAGGAWAMMDARALMALAAAQAALLGVLAMEGALGYAGRRWAKGPADGEFDSGLKEADGLEDERKAPPRRARERPRSDRRSAGLAAA